MVRSCRPRSVSRLSAESRGLRRRPRDFGIEHEKSNEGKALLKLFCEPTKAKKATKKNPAGVEARSMTGTRILRNGPDSSSTADRTSSLNERSRSVSIRSCPFQEQEQQIWVIDQKINARGIPIDLDFCGKAMKYAENAREALLYDMKMMTGCDNPNSPEQLKEWLAGQRISYKSRKECVEEALKTY